MPSASSAPVHIFAYGSLLSPASLARTVPQARLQSVVGAQLCGYLRTFDVAFPNDGSQGDKAYLDSRGHRPPQVLFANVIPARNAHVANGVLVPVGVGDLDLLMARERRYELIDVTGAIRAFCPSEAVAGPVGAFVGRAEFTDPAQVSGGVLSREYLATIAAGVRFWEHRYPGFEREYHASIRLDPGIPICDLTRVDRRGRPSK